MHILHLALKVAKGESSATHCNGSVDCRIGRLLWCMLYTCMAGILVVSACGVALGLVTGTCLLTTLLLIIRRSAVILAYYIYDICRRYQLIIVFVTIEKALDRRSRSYRPRYHAHTCWTPPLALASATSRRTPRRANAQIMTTVNDENCSLSILLTATHQKLDKS